MEWTSFDDFWAERKESPEVESFAKELVTGTWTNLEKIDAEIRRVASNWAIERMAVVDRSLLRLGTFELLFRDDIPGSVSINEILEVAKEFSSLESAAFINGILDSIARAGGKLEG